jgi:hypothetical protein
MEFAVKLQENKLKTFAKPFTVPVLREVVSALLRKAKSLPESRTKRTLLDAIRTLEGLLVGMPDAEARAGFNSNLQAKYTKLYSAWYAEAKKHAAP